MTKRPTVKNLLAILRGALAPQRNATVDSGPSILRQPGAPVRSLEADSLGDGPSPSAAPILIDGASQNGPTQKVSDADELPQWRGLVPNVVHNNDRAHCVVLDIAMSQAVVLATAKYFASGSHSPLKRALANNSWSIDAEITTSQDVIAKVIQLNAKRRETGLTNHNTSSEATKIQLAKDLLLGAFELNASDIHLDLPTEAEEKTLVRLRIDGTIVPWKTIETPILGGALASGYLSLSVKGTNSSSTWGVDRPINTVMRVVEGQNIVQARLTTHPLVGECGVSIRIIDGRTDVLEKSTLEMSGFTDQQIHEQLMPGLRRTKGFIIVGGATGEGKTTTTHRMLVNMPGRLQKNIIEVADPNENKVPGVRHFSIQRNADDDEAVVAKKYNTALITAMRFDPDVIVIAEVRDSFGADVAAQVVLTGHLAILTTHADTAIENLERMLSEKFSVDPAILLNPDNFGISMAQKLMPKLCAHCKVPASTVMEPDELRVLQEKYGLDVEEVKCAKPDGCPKCQKAVGIKGNGYKGRSMAAEIITSPPLEFLQCLRNGDAPGAKLAWRKTRRSGFDSPDMWGKTSYEVAFYAISQGDVSPYSLQDIFGIHFKDYDVLKLDIDKMHRHRTEGVLTMVQGAR
jgi:type II secretory ATPase GspE/PulE/Tfp pilus assembly ATPase PilB-like protein